MKTNKNSIFNLKSFVTVVILESRSTVLKYKRQVARSARQPLCTKYYNMNENASSASGRFNRKKRRLIASQFHLEQKPIS